MNHSTRFPRSLPEGYEYLDEEIRFDPSIHLALEKPARTYTLQDFGYGDAEIAQCPTDFAVSSAARILSDEGVHALQQVARTLRRYAVGCERIQNMVRGGVYQSRFLRDLCLCEDLTRFMSEIYGTEVAPHSMPLQLGHLNYAPDDLSMAVDKWHHDTLGLDCVLMVTDPNRVAGGRFQFFHGTKAEAEELWQSGSGIPDDRVVTPELPGAGWAIPLHGFMVVHRGGKLEVPGERIAMVNGYVPIDNRAPDPCRFRDLKVVDPHHVLFAEWARHKAWIARGKLDRLLDELPYTDDREVLIAALRDAVADVDVAIADLRDESEARMINYGG